MGRHRHGTIKKYFNIGFYEEELQVTGDRSRLQ